MRRTAGSLLVLLVLAAAGAAQDGVDEATLTRKLKDLAAADEKTRDEAIKGFRDIPGAKLEEIHALAARLGPAEKEAARRWLPHPAYAAIFPGTIGDVRRDLKDFLKYNSVTVRAARMGYLSNLLRSPVRPVEEVRRALGRLFDEGDSRARLLALDAYNFTAMPEPKKLLPLLEDPDPDLASAAAVLLVRTGDASLVPAVFKVFKKKPSPDAMSISSFLSRWGTPDLVPDLVEMLKNSPDLVNLIVPMLGALGDERVEPVLLERLETIGRNNFVVLAQALQTVGGAKTFDAVRKHRASLPEGDERRAWETDLLIRLRDPAMVADLIGQLREGRTGASAMGGSLLRLGDPAVVPVLVKYLREVRPKIDDRNSALYVIGVLGGPEETPILTDRLLDGRFAEWAAAGLGELRDPRSVKPLAEALKIAETPEPFVRALLRLPLAEAEPSLLEILDDPEGHEKVLEGAVGLAVRSGSPKLRARLLDMATAGGGKMLQQAEIVRALAPLVGPEDRARFAKGREAGKDLVAKHSAFLLAATGDPEGTKRFVEYAESGGFPWRERGNLNILSSFSPTPKPLVEEVERVFAAKPTWFDGAEFLAYEGKKTGEGVLLKQLNGASGRYFDTRSARALLRIGNARAIEDLLWTTDSIRLPPEDEERLALGIRGESMPRLRELAQSKMSLHDQMPARLLALRGDAASVRLFVSTVRGDNLDNPHQPQSNVTVMARALARMKVKEARRDFLRLLRSNAPGKRALGLECLGLLGDASALASIAPFLDDFEPLGRRPVDVTARQEDGSVSEAALTAVQRLSGRTFEGGARERLRAAKDWYAKEGK